MHNSRRHPAHSDFVSALKKLADARRSFARLAEAKLVLGNDNHIGDIGEYWARRYYEQCGQFRAYCESKVDPFDIALSNGIHVSVKSITSWSKGGYGTQVKPLDGKHWQALFAIKLNERLFPERVSIVPLRQLLERPVFVENERRRKDLRAPTKSYPRFEWWTWLDEFRVQFSASDADCIFET
jgi:hypothetical protein